MMPENVDPRFRDRDPEAARENTVTELVGTEAAPPELTRRGCGSQRIVMPWCVRDGMSEAARQTEHNACRRSRPKALF